MIDEVGIPVPKNVIQTLAKNCFITEVRYKIGQFIVVNKLGVPEHLRRLLKVFFYFGPYCPYSRAQMEEIIEDMDKLKNIRLYLLTNAPYNQMMDFYNYYNLKKYSNITVARDYTGFFLKYFEVEGVPYLAVYGKDKRLKTAFKGEVYGKQIKRSAES